jgi:hypothetical protein
VREALIVLWEASDRVCGKRLKPLISVLIEAMERHGHLELAPNIRSRLLAMSAATIDRALRDVRQVAAGGGKRRRSAISSALRRSVAIRTFSDWQDPPPGFVEADLVAHSGPSTSASFVQTLVLTDIATGWTECAPLLVREKLLSEVLTELRRLMPFTLLGFDTDTDSVFLNETIHDCCPGFRHRLHALPSVSQDRPGPCRAEERCRRPPHRRLSPAGGPRSGCGSGTALQDGAAVRELLPALLQTGRKGTRWRPRSQTLSCASDTLQRLLADSRTPEPVRTALTQAFAQLDPVRLLREMRAAQQRLVDVADNTSCTIVDRAQPPLDQFLAGLRTAWKEGEIRPTATTKPKPKRGRRRPDPLVKVTPELQAWRPDHHFRPPNVQPRA